MTKRKRKTHDDGCEAKRQRLRGGDEVHPATSLLRQYYPQVSTLRQYLASQLSKGSKKRRKKVLHYGLCVDGTDDPSLEVVGLLDTTLVGSPATCVLTDAESLEQDLSVFTQQLETSTISVGPSQGAFKQSEVGDCAVAFLVCLLAGRLYELSLDR